MTYRDTTLVEAHAWQRVRQALLTAKAITWDGCHKIYVLMDDEEVESTREMGYSPIVPVTDPDQALATLKEWFEESCGLRFISGVKTVDGDPNDGFTDLIAQGEFDRED